MNRLFLKLMMALTLITMLGGGALGVETAALYDNVALASIPDAAFYPEVSDERIAQPFWTGDFDNVSAVTIELNGRWGNATGQVSIEIWDDDGSGIPGRRVGVVGILEIAILPNRNEWQFHTFDDPVTGLTPNSRYFVLLNSTAANISSNDGVLVSTYASDSGTNGADFFLGSSPQSGYAWEPINDTFGMNTLSYMRMAVYAEVGPIEVATKPSPADETADVPRDVVLSWTPGDLAETHDVYLGTTLADVTAASRDDPRGMLVSQGQPDTQFVPERLEFDQIYYWRVDEVNDAPDYTIFKGAVWRFEVEPYSYPVPNSSVTVVASSHTEGQVPSNTINESGLSGSGQHSIVQEHMWLSDANDMNPSLQFAFEQPVKVEKIRVWNHNTQTESVLGFGMKEALLEHSLDGKTWNEFARVELAQATGLTSYTGQEIAWGDTLVQFIRVTGLSNHSLLGLTQTGLSEVKFYAIPTYAREPRPANGVTTEDLDVVLSWRAGREADTHEVLFSDNRLAVGDGSALISATNEAEADLIDQELTYDTTYYWQVNEVNELESPKVYSGNTWQFHTPAFITVDDMEQYRADNPHRIWTHWVDGVGDPSNGATVGNGDSPEKEVVHRGRQSMPFRYDNTSASVSEATRIFDPPLNWRRGHPDVLSLFFKGDPTLIREIPANDPAPLYVVIHDGNGREQKVEYPDPDATQIWNWREWRIPLIELNSLELSSITGLTLGVGGHDTSGDGKMFFDTIRVGIIVSDPNSP